MPPPRRELIAGHLARHVAAVDRAATSAMTKPATGALILRTLAADENSAVGSWEDDSGAPPKLTWPRPAGGALAALLGLAGTGVVAEYRPAGGPVAWRDRPTAVGGFGARAGPGELPGTDGAARPRRDADAGTAAVRERAQRLLDEGRDRRVARRRAGLHGHLGRDAADRAAGKLRVLGGRADARRGPPRRLGRRQPAMARRAPPRPAHLGDPQPSLGRGGRAPRRCAAAQARCLRTRRRVQPARPGFRRSRGDQRRSTPASR